MVLMTITPNTTIHTPDDFYHFVGDIICAISFMQEAFRKRDQFIFRLSNGGRCDVESVTYLTNEHDRVVFIIRSVKWFATKPTTITGFSIERKDFTLLYRKLKKPLPVPISLDEGQCATFDCVLDVTHISEFIYQFTKE